MESPQRVVSTQLTRDEVLQTLAGQATLVCEQASAVTKLSFQQSINCCGLTSVAYALSALGCPTTVDELFLVVGVNVESAVGDGMTLAEIYDASLRYVSRANLPVFVECYHFDACRATPNGFANACNAEAEAGIDDVVLFNFHSGIAHGMEKGGGGHFSVLTAINPKTGDVIMADVHGIKYGSYWSTPLTQMFEAMADKDSCGRARGALRFGRRDKNLKRPLNGLQPTQIDWTSPPSAYDTKSLASYIPSQWDEVLGVKNMEGVSALSAAMRLLEGDASSVARLDEIMRALTESYTYHLNNFLNAEKIAGMVMGLNEAGLTSAAPSVKKLSSPTAEFLRALLEEVGCGTDKVAVLVSYGFNKAQGAELLAKETGEAGVLTHGTRSWSLIAGFDSAAQGDNDLGVILAPTHNTILAGRLWATSLDRLAAAMCAIDGGSCSLVVLDSRQ